MQLQIAMNIFYDLIRQCLHYLRNAHCRNTLLICRQMIIVAKHFHIFLIIIINTFFGKCQLRNLV